MEPTDQVYLGDGLYAQYNGYQVELFAHNGIAKTQAVFLDNSVVAAFLDYLKALGVGRVS